MSRPVSAPGGLCLLLLGKGKHLSPPRSKQVTVHGLELETIQVSHFEKCPQFPRLPQVRGRGGREGGMCEHQPGKRPLWLQSRAPGSQVSGHGSLRTCQGPWPPRATPGPSLPWAAPPLGPQGSHLRGRVWTHVPAKPTCPAGAQEGWEPVATPGEHARLLGVRKRGQRLLPGASVLGRDKCRKHAPASPSRPQEVLLQTHFRSSGNAQFTDCRPRAGFWGGRGRSRLHGALVPAERDVSRQKSRKPVGRGKCSGKVNAYGIKVSFLSKHQQNSVR